MSTTCKSASFAPKCEESPRPAVANAPMDRPTASPARRGPTPNASGPTSPREPLLAAAQAGDRAALDELLASQRARSLASALRVLHNRDDAEDAVQDAFVKVWRQLPRFEGRSSFATWVHRIVINASLDVRRRCATRAESVEWTDQQRDPQAASHGPEPAGGRTPESELGDREVASLVRLAVAELPAAHRRTVELHELEDCSCQETATILRCPVGTVLSRLHYARARLADRLRPEVLEPLAA